MVRLVVIAILLMLVTACSTLVLIPTPELVQKAIALQLEQTEKQLSEKLGVDFQQFDIKRLSIKQQKSFSVENLPAYRVSGTYDLTVKLPNRSFTQAKKPFDLYLQIQREGKSWRLLLPESTDPDKPPVWHSYLIL
ncbi:hypothetical protein [Richelia sinica]|nr:hypothetical protein [Richelia sinica FACHB-800]